MTMTQNVARIAAAKEDIRQAIIAKGENVSASELLDTYANHIMNISQEPANIIQFERFTGRYNRSKKSLTYKSRDTWESIMSINVMDTDILPINPQKIYSTALLGTTFCITSEQFASYRLKIDLDWLDNNDNIVKSDHNLEMNYKDSKISESLTWDYPATATRRTFCGMCGLRIKDIPGWSGIPNGATKLKLTNIYTEVKITGDVYIAPGAVSIITALDNEGHEEPPTPPAPIYPTNSYNLYRMYNGKEKQVMNKIITTLDAEATLVFYDHDGLKKFGFVDSDMGSGETSVDLKGDANTSGVLIVNNMMTLYMEGFNPDMTQPTEDIEGVHDLQIDTKNNKIIIL